MKNNGVEDFEIFGLEKSGRTIYLAMDYGSHLADARVGFLADSDAAVIMATAALFVSGADVRSAKVMAETVIAHEMAHIELHQKFMKTDTVAESLTEIEFQANLLSAKELIGRGFSIDELLDAHSRLMMMDAISGEPTHAHDVSYSKSRRSTLEFLQSLKTHDVMSADKAITRAILTVQSEIDRRYAGRSEEAYVDSETELRF